MHANPPDHACDSDKRSCHDAPVALIDHHAVAHNLRQLRRLLAQAEPQRRPRIWAVAKADAYGHTLEQVYAGLSQADGLAILTLDEARRCRALGWTGPILAMSAQFTRAELEDPGLYPLHLIIDHEEQLAQIASLRPPFTPHVWLRHRGKLNHAGFDNTAYCAAFATLHAAWLEGRLAGLGHLQHYASAEHAESLRDERQAFKRLIAGMAGPVCTENSAALLLDKTAAAATDWVRSGIALYGISPLHGVDGHDLGLRPAMILQAPLYGIQILQPGECLGYNSIFRAAREIRVGLLRCGYAHGYPRALPEGCEVLVAGRKATIIGRVSMDTLTIDLSNHPDIGCNAIATLWGARELPIEAVARQANTIPAQLCTALTGHVPRRALA